MPLTACSTLETVFLQTATDSAICTDIPREVDELAVVLVEFQVETPAPVINEATDVIRGIDTACAE